MPRFTIEETWPVVRQVKDTIGADSPEAAMAELRRRRDGTEWYERQRYCDDSDGPSTLVVWDEKQARELLVWADDPRVLVDHYALVSAASAVLQAHGAGTASPDLEAALGTLRALLAEHGIVPATPPLDEPAAGMQP